jgi:hypothetical protein
VSATTESEGSGEKQRSAPRLARLALELPIVPQLRCIVLDVPRELFQAACMKKSIRNENPQTFDGERVLDGDEYS